MEKLPLEQAINIISEAYATLDNAKSDFDDVVKSALIRTTAKRSNR